MASARPNRKVIRSPLRPRKRTDPRTQNYQADRDSGVIGGYRPDPAPPSSTGGGAISGYGPPK